MIDQLLDRPITDFIPQREPMVMIDKIITCEGNTITTSFLVKSDNQFLSGNRFSESGMLENIAQTAAAKVGYECLKNNEPVPLGFIGSINKVGVVDYALVEQVITTEVIIQREVLNVTIIKGTCMLGDKDLATCEMKIILDLG
ncbi:MAG: 3-hydroxyacyl-ACP dehydratase [Reichenbachiella sp.]|uniref:3-hydroxyacyl-ACP dehydratase n=1 Tax=Reichenbachiella sp. TaxID=2184521 RepID=UPI0032664E37